MCSLLSTGDQAGTVTLLVNPADLSTAIGQKRRNIDAVKVRYGRVVKVLADARVPRRDRSAVAIRHKMQYSILMKLAFIIVMLLMFPLSSSLLAGETREIELNDGSVLTGEVLSLNNGVYTVRTNALGILRLEEAKIRSIRQRGTVSSRPSEPSSDTRSLQDKMMGDKDVMAMIQSLKDDPQFAKILEDPEIMNAVSSGDTAALMTNPKFLQLLHNPAVRDIQQKVAK